MALWQYNFSILPKYNSCDFSLSIQLEKKDGCFDMEHLWKLSKTKLDCFDLFATILPRNKSWSKSIILFGKEDTNCVEILVEDGSVIDVSVRIDFTTEYTSLLTDIVEFCIMKEFIMVDEQLNVVPLRVVEILTLIEHSPQREKFNLLSKSK